MRAYGSRHPGAAPVWHAQADSAACRPVSTEPPDALRASRRYEARVSGTGGRCRLDTLTFRNREEQQLEIGVTGVARFVRSGTDVEVAGRFCNRCVSSTATAGPRDRRRL